jgi:hypothetical protein
MRADHIPRPPPRERSPPPCPIHSGPAGRGAPHAGRPGATPRRASMRSSAASSPAVFGSSDLVLLRHPVAICDIEKSPAACPAHRRDGEPSSIRNEIIDFPVEMSRGRSCGRNPRLFLATILVTRPVLQVPHLAGCVRSLDIGIASRPVWGFPGFGESGDSPSEGASPVIGLVMRREAARPEVIGVRRSSACGVRCC